MNILFLKGFNNYFNRIIKKYSTLDDYKNNSTSYLDFSNINFNPNDGVATQLIVGNENQTEGDQLLSWEFNGTPDYLIAYDIGDGENLIRSRWFILESERLRTGQYRLALKRDLVADHFNQIMNAPCFVEKGIIKENNNPLLYNNESMTYNQIKKEEYLLKDSTNSAWIVGYYAKNYDPGASGQQVSTEMSIIDGVPAEYYEEDELPFSVSASGGTTVYAYTPNTMSIMLPIVFFKNGGWGRFYANQGFEFVGYNQGSDKNFSTNTYASDWGISTDNIGGTNPSSIISNGGYNKFKLSSTIVDGVRLGEKYTISTGDGRTRFEITPVYNYTDINLIGKKYFYTWDSPLNHDQNLQSPMSNTAMTSNDVSQTSYNNAQAYINTQMNSLGGNVAYGSITSYNNKYVKIGTKYYRMSINATTKDRYDIWVSTYTAGTGLTINALDGNNAVVHSVSGVNSLMSAVLTSIQNNNSNDFLATTSNMPAAAFITASTGYTVVLSEISVETLNITLHQNKRITYDCPANIFAIPYGNVKFKVAGSNDTYTTNPDEGLALARAIAAKMGASVCYDLQLLPYVPSSIIRELMEESDTLTLTDLENANYEVATRTSLGTTSTATFVIYPSSSKGTFDILQEIDVFNLPEYSTSLKYKVSNEVEICRLASPNYNGMFEFSLAKNNGMTKVNVDYTYKPYQPYIHLNPDFKFIYGQDWNDSRGLICNGDFSLTFINDAWQEYQNNNKNYQSIFNRQIENMDVNNQIAKEKLEWQTFAGYFGGGITGAVGGAVAGAKAGGGYGALAGAVGGAYMGTVGAIIGGEMDKDWLQRQQVEAKDYAMDMYGYQLGNIKALPYSLSRSEALTNNNKLWPLIEIYRATDEEINNLINKIAYNGMTIMVIDKLANYATSDDFSIVYVKGQLIRLEDIDDDFHIADALYQEVKKGFYIPQGGN